MNGTLTKRLMKYSRLQGYEIKTENNEILQLRFGEILSQVSTGQLILSNAKIKGGDGTALGWGRTLMGINGCSLTKLPKMTISDELAHSFLYEDEEKDGADSQN